MMPPRAPVPGQIQSPNPLGNPAPAHSMAPSRLSQAQTMAPMPGGVPSGMRGLPQGLTPDMLQNPQFMAMLQQMLMQQRPQMPQNPMAQNFIQRRPGFSKNLMGY